MIVCIAEKQSVAQIYASVLGATAQHQGYYEGNGYQVTWTFGHLCELKEPHEYYPQWKYWNLGYLPMIPPRFGIRLKEEERVKRQFAIIKKLFEKADLIINGGDAGQEGELIQRWVLQMTGARCPVKRLWVSSMAEEAIRDAFSKMKDQSEYQTLYEAGLARAIGDWLLGMNATRLYTLKYGRGRSDAPVTPAPPAAPAQQRATGSVLSIGRVQTPTLALIVNRQLEIEHFVPRQSWVLSTLYRDVKFSAITRDEEAEAEDAAQVAEAARQGKTQKPKGPIYKTLEYDTEEQGKAIVDAIRDNHFTVTDVNKKRGTEAPPRLYDLTSLQVDCNRKFGFSADQALQLIQSLYEKKFTTYPRVDTTFLPDDMYPKCPGIMNSLFKTQFSGKAPYADLIRPLGGGKQLRKSKKVFDTSKVTDHHAIIPTGVTPFGLTEFEQKVFDLVARAFIAAFYDDCKFETTTVFGTVALTPAASQAPSTGDTLPSPADEGSGTILFRTSGKVITDEGWKVVFRKADTTTPDAASGTPTEGTSASASLPDTKLASAEVSGSSSPLLPVFSKGESGPHTPGITEKWTTPPKPYTEATILRAMETAGRFVDDAELRDAMKENGIGRPSTRAAIIETLLRRHYIRRERKTLVATPMGIDLIATISNELLKSAELTGRWEKKLRQIEHGQYDTRSFIAELKEMVGDVVRQVLSDNSNKKIE